MAIHLEDYPEILDDLPSDALDVMRASWGEAARVLFLNGI